MALKDKTKWCSLICHTEQQFFVKPGYILRRKCPLVFSLMSYVGPVCLQPFVLAALSSTTTRCCSWSFRLQAAYMLLLSGPQPHVLHKGLHKPADSKNNRCAPALSGPVNHTQVWYRPQIQTYASHWSRPDRIPGDVDWNPHGVTGRLIVAALRHSPQSLCDELLRGATASRSSYCKGATKSNIWISST